jgi:transcriptional regulator
MARPNAHWPAFLQGERAQQSSLAIFRGPHAYISPSWYAADQAVPTWNYEAVHAYGIPTILDDPRRVREVLESIVRTFERGRPEPWTTARLSEDYLSRMANGIVAFEMPIARLEGKRKLGQNRSSADILGAAAGLRAEGGPIEGAVADLMTEVGRG